MLSLRLGACLLELMHCDWKAWLAEVIPLEQMKSHAVRVTHFLTLTAPLWLHARLKAELAYDILHRMLLILRLACALKFF